MIDSMGTFLLELAGQSTGFHYLFHFLWQAGLIWLVVRLTLSLTPRIQATTRASVWVLSFVAIASLPLVWLVPRQTESTVTASVTLAKTEAPPKKAQPAPREAELPIAIEQTRSQKPIPERFTQTGSSARERNLGKAVPSERAPLESAHAAASAPRVERASTVSRRDPAMTPGHETRQAEAPVAAAAPSKGWNAAKAANGFDDVLLMLWLMIASLLMIRLVHAFWALHRMKKMSHEVNGPLADWFSDQAWRMGIERTVRLAETDALARPVAAGFFEPVILLPMGLTERMERNEIEAVLIHELAHLKRGDDWNNLFIRVVQALLFFQPFLHIARRYMERDRELACDDWVLDQRQGDRKLYASALVKLFEMTRNQHHNLFALSSVRKKSHLSQRVEHLLARSGVNATRVARLPLAFATLALLTGLGSLAWALPRPYLTLPAFSLGDALVKKDQPERKGTRTDVATTVTRETSGPRATRQTRVLVGPRKTVERSVLVEVSASPSPPSATATVTISPAPPAQPVPTREPRVEVATLTFSPAAPAKPLKARTPEIEVAPEVATTVEIAPVVVIAPRPAVEPAPAKRPKPELRPEPAAEPEVATSFSASWSVSPDPAPAATSEYRDPSYRHDKVKIVQLSKAEKVKEQIKIKKVSKAPKPTKAHVSAGSTYHIETVDDGVKRTEIRTKRFELMLKGDITFNEDETAITSMGSDAKFVYKKPSSGRELKIKITPGRGGSPNYELTQRGKRISSPEQVQRWLAENLPDIIRETGYAADERIQRRLATGSKEQVRAYIDRTRADFARRYYIEAFLDHADIDQDDLRWVKEHADRFDSSYHIAVVFKKLLHHADRAGKLDEFPFPSWQALESDYHQAEILAEALALDDLPPFFAKRILEGSADLKSDYHQAEILKKAINTWPSDQLLDAGLIDQLINLDSDYHMAEVLTRLLKDAQLSPEQQAQMLQLVKHVDSDYHRSQVLEHWLAQNEPSETFFEASRFIDSDHHQSQLMRMTIETYDDDETQGMVIETLDTIDSSHHQKQVLESLLRNAQMTEETQREFLAATARVDSDSQKSQVLMRFLDKYDADGDLHEAFLQAATSLSSDYQLKKVLSRKKTN
ncbi:M48 family metalloprotease [Sulfidibacter corallicola]|uniref:M48 family metalloprotease n=1 Tax=Sulfidibacter corallicola TaxID=2818388 RepID=A0A8A4TQV8_SULCO|nr:M56 family metallopeptidase [Sulfidibacter corallicola]QTD51940.1 M48 family metalloprotease [Sulfidibacter corallicola]